MLPTAVMKNDVTQAMNTACTTVIRAQQEPICPSRDSCSLQVQASSRLDEGLQKSEPFSERPSLLRREARPEANQCSGFHLA